MRVFSTSVHGILDYLVGLLLIIAPWALGFHRDGAETWVPVFLGIITLVYSLFTDYEMGVGRKISMKTHLKLDVFSGVFLAASPWIFQFHDYIYLPHLVIGLFEILAAMMTDSSPYRHKATVIKGAR